jgi:tol-pal system protein YbgF
MPTEIAVRPSTLAGRIVLVLAFLAALALPASAQSQQEAQLAVRIQQLEEQIRLLTGQVEGLQFQLTQMQTLIERMAEDNEFRFQQLEGGGVPPQQQGSATPEALPAQPAPQQETAALPDPGPLDLGGGAPLHDLGESADPLVGTTGGVGELAPLDGSRPLDLSFDGGPISNGDATAQFQAGYEAIMRGDYAFAEDQFTQFIALYPDDPNAADATNYLGDALMQRGAFDDAALVLAEGYQKYETSPRAPDLMLKLGVALAGTGEVEMACRTFFTLEKRFPGQSPAFTQRLADEKARSQCRV